MTIILNTNSLNVVPLTLTESSSLQTPYYLFEFFNEFNSNVVYFNATDLSDYCNSYNLFHITETGSTAVSGTALNNGIININPVGQWSYNIYEATAQTLSISATTGVILESGVVIVIGENSNSQINEIYL